MSKLQEIYNRVQSTSKEIKEINRVYKDALANSLSYQDIDKEIKDLKASKKSIEDSIKADFSSEFSKMDSLKLDMDNDKMLLADVSITMLSKGESIEVVDEKGNKHYPIFKVNFKKS